jgi:hypothetical protein
MTRSGASIHVTKPCSSNKYSINPLPKTPRKGRPARPDDNYSYSRRYRSPFAVKTSQIRPSRLHTPFAAVLKLSHGLPINRLCRQLPSRINLSTIRSSETPSRPDRCFPKFATPSNLRRLRIDNFLYALTFLTPNEQSLRPRFQPFRPKSEARPCQTQAPRIL